MACLRIVQHLRLASDHVCRLVAAQQSSRTCLGCWSEPWSAPNPSPACCRRRVSQRIVQQSSPALSSRKTGFPVNVRVSVAPSYSARAAVAVEFCAPPSAPRSTSSFSRRPDATPRSPSAPPFVSIAHWLRFDPRWRRSVGGLWRPRHKVDRQHISGTCIDVSIGRHHANARLPHTIQMLHLISRRKCCLHCLRRQACLLRRMTLHRVLRSKHCAAASPLPACNCACHSAPSRFC